ncbi:ABC transporter ATP-binding protein [Paenibacillus cymbidii]|uniref:ABC transporter ATP-binding protein n=1 Tax=Paenibacillus cymbidii TaxID=1639034 RepID=UPI0010811519|nr:ABC transporter ATP-binding protein [Paenibacillus cymbidii]
MGYLLPYYRKHGKLFYLAILFVTLEALADLTLPTVMAHILDSGVAAGNLHVVWRLGGLMLLITAGGAVAAAMRNIVASRVSQKFGAELRGDLFRKIQLLGFRNIDRFERASLITRLTNDVTQVQNFVNGLMRIFVKAPLLGIGSLVMAALLNPRLAIVPAVVVPIVAVLIALNMKFGFARFLGVQKALDRVNATMREYLSGVRVVKAFNRFDFEVDKFEESNLQYRDRSIRVMRIMAAFNPAVMLTVNFGIVAVIWLGALRVDSGHMQIGHIVAFVNYMTQLLFALMTVFMVFNMLVRARASHTRIGEVFAERDAMQTAPLEREPSPDAKGGISFDNVTFAYEGMENAAALKGVTFDVLPGESIGLIGSTGSGKSTIASLIPRFYDTSGGVVRVNGADVRQVDPRELRETIAIVPQKTVLFTGTIAENIGWGRESASREDIELASRLAEAHEFVSTLPDGYETRLGQRGVNLSGGQKQRVSIARALVRKPDILILDDCTSAVDTATESRIKQALRDYAQGITCLLIAQRITSVMDLDKIVVLDEGQVVGIGKHETLLRECEVYREIFQSQVGKESRSNVKAE